MGTLYFVACRDCNEMRDLDKFYAALAPVENRVDALKLADNIKEYDSFKAGLLVSFMSKHRGHNCTFLSEHDDEYLDIPEEPSFWE